jgi:hypothetical protein
MELPINTATLLVQIINFTIICVLLFISFLVYRDAKKHGLATSSALRWAVFCLLVLPIGLTVYIYFGRNNKNKKNHDGITSDIS